MSLNRSVNQDSGLRVNNSGGLNKTTQQVSLPFGDADELVNFDIGTSGQLVKRKGTRVIVSDSLSSRLSAVKFDVTPRVGFIVVKSSVNLLVYSIYDDTPTIIGSWGSVFKSAKANISSVELFDGEVPSVLLLSEGTAPIQLFAYFETSLGHTGTTYTYYDQASWNLLRSSSMTAFVNGNVYPTSNTSTQITGLPAYEKDLDIIALRWYWWAEAETWFGNSFFHYVSRAGDAQSDQHVQIPEDIRTDLSGESEGIPIALYSSDAFDAKYVKTSGTPELATEYSFSEGINFDIQKTPDVVIRESSLFASFGSNNFQNKQLILETNVDLTADKVRLDNHGYRNKDKVYFEVGEDGTVYPGTSEGVDYFVKKLDDNSFELYTNITLLTKVLFGQRDSVFFTDQDIRYSDSSILVTSHGLSNGDIVVVGSNYRLPTGLVDSKTYYAKVFDANRIILCFDKYLKYTVYITPQQKIFFYQNSTDVVNDWINIGASDLLDGDNVRFYPAVDSPVGGSLPVGLVAGTVYYIRVIGSTYIQIHTHVGLNALVNLTSVPGSCYLIRDLGLHYLRRATGKVYLQRKGSPYVGIHRRRRLHLNGGEGVLSSNLQIDVDGVVHTLTTTTPGVDRYRGFTDYDTTVVSTSTPIKLVSFEGGNSVGLPLTSRVRMVNKQPVWVGSGLNTEASLSTSGGWIPVYGIGRFADYKAGSFPTTGELVQGRLALTGISKNPGLVLFSSVSDSFFAGEFFRYYQITDALTTPATDPFDLNIVSSRRGRITGLINYQSSLFVMTGDTAFRLTGSDSELSINTAQVYTVAYQGAVNEACVGRSENSVFMISSTGVYDLAISDNDNFKSSELSQKVSKLFRPLLDSSYSSLPWLLYDNYNLKFYVGLPENSTDYNEKLLVFDIRTSSWTEYKSYAGFRTNGALVYRDNKTGYKVALTGRSECFATIIRLNYKKYADYVQLYLNATLPQVGLPPTFEYQNAYTGVDTYVFDVYSLPFINYLDYSVKIVNNLLASTIDSADAESYVRVKSDKFTIRLETPVTTGQYIVLVKETRVMWVNNIPTTYNQDDFAPRDDYGDICTIGT